VASKKRTSVHLDARLHRALQLKAKANDCTISEVVADALRQVLAQEAHDIEKARPPARPPAPDRKMTLAAVGARLKRRTKV
jgi:hypothetical protein